MLITVVVTVIVEGVVAFGYALWRKKPAVPILVTTVVVNLLTQFLLWLGLHLLFQHYLPTVLIADVLIWMFESLALHRVRANKLDLWEAIFLSLIMNLASVAIGWFLPV